MVFLTGVSLFPLPTEAKIQLAKKHGFDGIEVLVTAKNKNRLADITRKIRESGLRASFHQPWSLAESPTYWFNKMLDAFGVLPEADYSLESIFSALPKDVPVTLYAERIREEWNHPHKRFQTCASFSPACGYRISYTEFCFEVRRQRAKITFDTQHVLEHMLNVPGVEGLDGRSRNELCRLLIDAWNTLGGKDAIEEIHWCDCSPALGHILGRNVFPGTGMLPLREFADYIIRDGWDFKTSTVVPEVASVGSLIFRGKEIRKRTAEYF